MHAQQLYIPYKISIVDILSVMRDELPYGKDIDLSVVMMEMLQNVFFERNNHFGKFQGILGSYLIQAPRVFTEEEQFQIDITLNDHLGLLTDMLSSIFPSLVMRPLNHYFYYPPGEMDLLIYVPVTSDLSPELSAKAIPENAIRNSIR